MLAERKLFRWDVEKPLQRLRGSAGVWGTVRSWRPSQGPWGTGKGQRSPSRGAGRPDVNAAASGCAGLHRCLRAPSSCAGRGHSPAAEAPPCGGGATLLPQRLLPTGAGPLSCRRGSSPRGRGHSPAAEAPPRGGVLRCGAVAQLPRGLWGLSGPGMGPTPRALARGFLTTEPPRKSKDWICKALF